VQAWQTTAVVSALAKTPHPAGLAVCGFFIMLGLVSSSFIVEERHLLEDMEEPDADAA
jgi:hypothetical protein